MTARFGQLLKQRIGLDVESVGQVVIERAIRQRMKATLCNDEDGYWQTLVNSPAEQHALVEAVVVPETWFFRYPGSFSVLAELAQDRLTALKHARALRIISLPCSTGEEPYSIVMALLDAGLQLSSFEVEALDVSERVLALAGHGLYGRNSFRGDDLTFRDRYFTAEGERFRLHESVRSKVRLQCANLLDANLHTTRQPYDFVFCRNLLIYFDRPTQLQALTALKRLLSPEGAIFTGPAETGLFSQNGLQAIGVPLSFAFKLAAPSVKAKPQAPALVAKSALPARSALRPALTKPAPARAALSTFKPKEPSAPAPTAAVVNAELALIEALANQGRTSEAQQACEALLTKQGPSAAVFYWLGLLSDVAGQPDAAQNHYRKALYLEPEHSDALSHLAMLLEARGDRAGAQRLRDRASRGVTKDGR